MKKGRISDILIGTVVIYLFLGVAVVSVQHLSGASCGPIKLGGHYVYTVNVEAPRFWGLRVLKWLPTFWTNVVDGEVPLADFITPKECVWVPDGMTAVEALERSRKKSPGEL